MTLFQNKPTRRDLGQIDITLIDPPTDSIPPSAEMRASVADVGIVEPLIVYRAAGRFKLISGRRRYLSGREAGLEVVPAVELVFKNRDDAEALTLALNRLRSRNPVSDVRAAAALLKAGIEEADIRKATGLRAGEMKRLRVLALCDERLLEGISEGRLPVSRAFEIARLPQEKQAEVLAGDGKISGETVKAAVSVARSEVAVELPPDLFVDDPPPALPSLELIKERNGDLREAAFSAMLSALNSLYELGLLSPKFPGKCDPDMEAVCRWSRQALSMGLSASGRPGLEEDFDHAA